MRDLRGHLSLRAKYDEHGTGAHVRRAATGSVNGVDVALGVRGVDAIWTRTFALSRFDVDIDQRRVVLGDVRLKDPEAWVRHAEGGFAFLGEGASSTEPGRAAWTITVKGIDAAGGAVHIADVERKQQLDVRLTSARLGSIAGPKEPIAIALEAALGSGGRVSAKGDLVRQPLGGRGHLEAVDVELAPLTRFARTTLAFESGRLSGAVDLRVANQAFEVTGSLHAQGVKTLSPDPARPEDVLAFKDLRVGIRQARSDPKAIDLDKVELEWPYVLIDRGPSGIFPLTLFSRSDAQGVANSYLPPRMHLDDLDVMGGRIDFRDTTLEPQYWRALAEFKLAAKKLDAAPLRIASLSATALIDELSSLRVEGAVGERTRLVADIEKLSLPPFNPYLEGTAPYTLSSGTVSAHSEIVLERSQLEVQNRVVLSRLGLKGTAGQDFIQREVGVPLTLALALMKDYRGNIELGLPFGGNLDDQTFSMRSVVLQAIVRTVRGAVMSPLTALGRVFLRDGRVEQFDLDPTPFAPGSPALDDAGRARIQQIARVLAGHPDLVVRVRGRVAQADVDHLRDEAALAALVGHSSTEDIREFLRTRLSGNSPPPSIPIRGNGSSASSSRSPGRRAPFSHWRSTVGP